MRKKEPPSPIMAAAGRDAQQTHAVAKVLRWKRQSIDQEIEEFRARKELEFKNFEEGLSKGGAVPDQVDLLDPEDKPQPDLQQLPRQGGKSPEPHATADPAAAASIASTNDDKSASAARQQPPASPLTPLHDKERDLHGLFLPYFIPLLDNASVKRRDASPSTTQAPTTITTAVTTTTTTFIPTPPGSQGAELPAQPEGFNSTDPSILSPRTSPSPSLMPLEFPFPRTHTITTPITNLTDLTDLTATASSKLDTELQRSPSPSEDLAADLPPLTRTLSRTASTREPPPEITSPQPTRPTIGTRSSSTQSEASTRSLRSSLRKTHSDGPSHGRKKSVRISINEFLLEPGGKSPVQTRNAWKIPERKNVSDEICDFGDESTETLMETASSHKNAASHVENIEPVTPVHTQSPSPKKTKSSKGSKGSQKGKRPASLEQTLQRSGSDPGYESTFIPSFYPPQQLRSPSKIEARPNGRELIEPTATPPANTQDFDQDDVFTSDMMFPDTGSEGLGWSKQNNSRSRSSNGHKSRDKHTGKVLNANDVDLDEEDMFQDYEDGREEMDVVNGHDLLDWEEEKERKSAQVLGKTGRGVDEDWLNIGRGPQRNGFRRDEGSGSGGSSEKGWVSEVSTSPHAGSLPIEIRGPRGWLSSGWR